MNHAGWGLGFYVWPALDNKIDTDVAVFDFSKAFDSVPHRLLLSKLDYYGIRGNLHKWISNFLHGRTQRVIIDGSFSEWLPVSSGVPQGSVLGPLLFLMYINDIGEGISSNIKLFADNLIMYTEIKNTTCHRKFQSDLNILHEWAATWEMNFNLDKCHIVKISRRQIQYKHKYTLGTVALSYADNFTYLVVTITSDLSWSSHIAKTYRLPNFK